MLEDKETYKEIDVKTLSDEERIWKWHEAGVEARRKNKEKRDAEREKIKEWLSEHPEDIDKFQEDKKKKKKIKPKRRGRPKKRGPKKKKKYISKKKKTRIIRRFDFKIVSTLNGKQNEYLGKFSTLEDAYDYFHKLEKQNSEIVFRRKLINAGCIKDSRDEYLLLQKNRNGELGNTMLRNQYGKLVEQISSNPKWVIYDKCDRYVEETFWVYGHCPKTDRKTFKWIYDNMVIDKLINDYDIERILLYKNKLIIKYDDGEMGIVICKNCSDSLRFYELLQIWCKRKRQIFFLGSFDKISDRRRDLEDEIMKYTGWDKVKIQRDSTRA